MFWHFPRLISATRELWRALLAQGLAATVWSGRRLGQGVAAPEDPARAPLEAAS